MRFVELEIGAIFQHNGLNCIKVSERDFYLFDSAHISSGVGMEVTKEMTMKFKDLEIGDKFRFCKGGTLCTKTEKEKYTWDYSYFGNTICGKSTTTVYLEKTRFKDLKEGDWFKFTDSAEFCYNKGKLREYSRGTSGFVCSDVNRVVEILKSKTFDDLTVGSEFFWINSTVCCVKLNGDMFKNGNKEEYVYSTKRLVVSFPGSKEKR